MMNGLTGSITNVKVAKPVGERVARLDETILPADIDLKRMAEWATEPRSEQRSGEAQTFDRRFRATVANDLDMPQALVVLGELVASGSVSAGEKYSLASAWDSVLGLDLERAALEGWEPSPEVNDLVRRRDEARRARDYATSDGIRKQLIDLGLEVMDTADGTRVRPRG